MSIQNENLTFALSKGRILEESLPLLAAAGITLSESPAESRKLIFETSDPQVRILIIRAADVPVFVARGAADIGVTGKDVLLENDVSNLYEPADLGIARCRLMLASLPGADMNLPRLRVATKYVQTTRAWFAEQGRQVDLIRLYGSMELAPVVGMADAIVDVVESGNTLRENGLVTREHIMDISSRLIVNRASMKIKSSLVKPLVARLAGQVM